MTADDIQREQTEALLLTAPFAKWLGLRVETIDPPGGAITLSMQFRADFAGIPGSRRLHGGPMAALIDTAASAIVSMSIGHAAATINFRTDYLHAATGDLMAQARIQRLGQSIAVVDVDVQDESGDVVAIGRGTFNAG